MDVFGCCHRLFLFGRCVALVLSLWLLQLLYRGITVRLKFRAMQKQGMPVPEPHSMLLGHLQFFKQLKNGLPKDAHSSYAQRHLALHWQKYFPGATQCPPIVYIDLWPFLQQPLIMAISPEACFQLTQENPQPRDSTFRWAMFPVTGGKDMISMNTADHRLWRSRLNPGFASRNLMLGLPILLEEVGIFARQLKDQAGVNKGWGDKFTLYERTVSLTFDIIMRTALHEQTEGPGPILKAMRQLLTHVKAPNLWTKLERFGPDYRRDVAMQNNIIREQLLPQINAQLAHTDPYENSQKHSRTVISLALSEVRKDSETNSQQGEHIRPNPDFIDIVESQLRLFISAGHDTTAQAICWIFYEINKSPAILTKLREEHDSVFGANPSSAIEILTEKPHTLNALPYTTAIIKETLRLHPLGSTFRRGSSSFQFVHEGIRYPTEGALIQTNPTVLQLRADLWPRATEFLPDRFLAAAQREDHPFHPVKNAWRAFELGHTRCIGEELAMMEMKLALILTVRELDFDFGPYGSNNGEATSLDAVDGEHIYRVGDGVGYVKDYLPTRVRLR
ncbi:cytochrome P450 [Astrocystis sublimbata]|nr:cytochrome P450 [Astrocystis sublimbata]